MDLGHGLLALGWALTGAAWIWRAHRRLSPLLVKKALLLNTQGCLDSVRTITGQPPASMTCAAGRYELDRTADSQHWVYRCR